MGRRHARPCRRLRICRSAVTLPSGPRAFAGPVCSGACHLVALVDQDSARVQTIRPPDHARAPGAGGAPLITDWHLWLSRRAPGYLPDPALGRAARLHPSPLGGRVKLSDRSPRRTGHQHDPCPSIAVISPHARLHDPLSASANGHSRAALHWSHGTGLPQAMTLKSLPWLRMLSHRSAKRTCMRALQAGSNTMVSAVRQIRLQVLHGQTLRKFRKNRQQSKQGQCRFFSASPADRPPRAVNNDGTRAAAGFVDPEPYALGAGLWPGSEMPRRRWQRRQMYRNILVRASSRLRRTCKVVCSGFRRRGERRRVVQILRGQDADGSPASGGRFSRINNTCPLHRKRFTSSGRSESAACGENCG